MTRSVRLYATPPAELFTLLSAHLPYSLPLLRRLQFTRLPGGITRHSHVLYASSSDLDSTTPRDVVFAAAYLDFSRNPETEMWMYSSLEQRPDASADEVTEATKLAVDLLREVKRIRDQWDGQRSRGPGVIVGTLNEVLREALEIHGVRCSWTSIWDKWIFNVDSLPQQKDLEKGMQWGKVRSEDIALVLSRTKITRTEKTMLALPNITINLDNGTPIAWCFLGPDSSLSSLHVEEPYRGNGLAKAVAVRLLRERLVDFGDDGLCSADVAEDNLQSQGVCRSLGGKIAWTISWSELDLDTAFPDA